MDNGVLLRADRVLHWVHSYTGLFLLPWMLVYGASAFCLNHNQWLIEKLNVTPPHWETLRRADFTPDDTFPQEPAKQARVILKMLDLDGAHNIMAQPNRNQMVINRVCGTGNYRITWQPARSQIIVEKQESFSFYRLMHFLHFRGGYIQPYFVNIAWAIIVDVVAVSMGMWAFSGVYLWWRRSRRLLVGWACLLVGVLLFVGFTILFCR